MTVEDGLQIIEKFLNKLSKNKKKKLEGKSEIGD